MLRLRARVDLEAMALKEYSAFPKAPALLVPHRLLSVISKTLVGRASYHSAEMQLVYSTAQADWSIVCVCVRERERERQSECVCVCVCSIK